MGGGGVKALLFGLGRLDPGSGGGVAPVGDLHDVTGDAVEIADVILPTGTQLATDWVAEEVGQQGGGFKFGAVAFGLLGVSHQRLPVVVPAIVQGVR